MNEAPPAAAPNREDRVADPLLEVRGLTRTYRRPGGAGGRQVVALDGVSLTIGAGAIFGLVGESGSGKSTLARCLALLETPDRGEIRFAGSDCAHLRRRPLRAMRRRIQLLFQDPAAAISPRFSAAEAVAEPLRVAGRGDRAARRRRVLELLAEVELPAALAARSTLALSGGQKQRLALARALAAEPTLLILDEGFSGLDLSLQAQMVNLLLRLQSRHALTFLLISHDLRLVGHLADEVGVLHQGRLVERAPPRDLLSRPRHPATRDLIAALPTGLGRRR